MLVAMFTSYPHGVGDGTAYRFWRSRASLEGLPQTALHRLVIGKFARYNGSRCATILLKVALSLVLMDRR
jgi:hypothetical protein